MATISMDNLIKDLETLASGQTDGVNTAKVAKEALERLEVYEESLKTWTMITSSHDMDDGSHIVCHPLVGVNEWRGDSWQNFYQITLDEFLTVMEALRKEAEENKNGNSEEDCKESD